MPSNALNRLRAEYDAGASYAEDPSFMETVGASMAYKYDPIATFFEKQSRNFPRFSEAGFIAKDHIPKGYEQYASTLIKANNQAHMDFLVEQIDRGRNYRQVLAESGIAAQFAAELFDPVNWLSVPLSGGATFAARAVRAGTGVATITAAQEAIRAPLDPLGTTSETAINIGSSFVLGGLIGGLTGIPAARRAQAIQNGAVEIERLQRAIDPDNVEFDATIAENIFTDTWLYKSISTPMKRTLQDSTLPNSVKLDILKLANDNGLLLSSNRKGKALDPSVYLLAKLREGEMVVAYDKVKSAWADARGGITEAMDYMAPSAAKEFDGWSDAVNRKRLRGEAASDEFEQAAMDAMAEFYDAWQPRLVEEGMIGDAAYFKRAIERKQSKINELELEMPQIKSKFALERQQRYVTRLRSELDELKANLEDVTQQVDVNPPKEAFFPRYWDKDAIAANRESLEDIFAKWYDEQPYVYQRDKRTGQWKKIKTDRSPNAIQARAKETVDNILGLNDDAVESFGSGVSKHFRHRALDIPNSLVLDFIHTDPMSVMRMYTSKVAPRYEFSKKFGGKSVDDVVDEIMINSVENGASVETAARAAADFRGLQETIFRTSLRNPDHWSHTVARYMRSAATLSYLGSAGLSTITEPAKIIMEHGLGPTMRGLFSVLKSNQLKLGAKEGRVAGEALETLLGSVHMRAVEDVTNPLRGDVLDKAQNAFFLLNALGPITRALKDFDAMMRVHTLIDYSVRATKGKASKMELDYLARYGIDSELADRISRKPWQKSESGMYMANTEDWLKLDFDQIVEEVRKTYSHSSKPIHKMTEGELLKEFGEKFYFDRVITDPKIVRKVMSDKGYPDALGYSLDFGDGTPNTIYMDFDAVRSTYRRLKEKSDDMAKLREDLEAVRDRIGEEGYIHKSKLLDNIDIIESEDDFIRFVFLHELHHSTTRRNAGESLVDYEGRIDDLAYAYMRNEREEGIRLTAEKEYDMRLSKEQDDVTKFRAALSSGIMNTILMGTPADKPIITNGIALIPMRVAKQFGMKEDPKYTGYARIENGLLALPFQFYSYALAALNKVTVAHAQGQMKNQILGSMIAMGLGYMLLQVKTPDYVEMSFQDQFARSFDYSGLASLHSDLMYTAMTTSLALGGPNITGGILQPRFPVEPNAAEGIAGLAGAGPSYTYDVSAALYDLMSGNVSEGSKDLIRNLPFARLWFLKGYVNNMTNALSDRLEQTDGFGRF